MEGFEKELREAFVMWGPLAVAAIARREHERAVRLERELAEERGEISDPEWERIKKLSDDEVKAELIADGVYKDEADIAEHAAKFTLRVHEMLRMKAAGERIGRKRMLEGVVGVAVRRSDGLIYSLPRPARHPNLSSMYNEVARKEGFKDSWVGWEGRVLDDEQGFVDAQGRFLTRTEAAEVARASGQVPATFKGDLFSEDVW